MDHRATTAAWRSIYCFRKQLLRVVSALFLLLFVRTPPAQGEEVALGVLTELSGPYAAVGSDCISGFNIAWKALRSETKGSSRLKLIYEDTKSDPTTAISGFHKLAANAGVLAFFTTFTKIALPLNPLSKQAGIVLLATSGHPALLGQNPYAFRFFPSAKAEGTALSVQAQSLGLKKAALLTLQEEWNEVLSAEFRRHFAEGDRKVVYEEQVAPNETDLGSYVVPLRASAPDIVFVNLTFGQIGSAIRKLREQGVRQRVFSNYRLQYKETLAAAGAEALEGAMFFEVSREEQKRFSRLLETQAPNAAFSVAFVCYTALASLIQALNDHPGPLKREEFALALQETTSVELLDQKLKIVQREAQYKLSAQVIRNGVAVPLERFRQ